MNLIKKLFIYTVILSTVLMGFSFDVAKSVNLSAGMLVKRPDMSAVYYLYDDAGTIKRAVFPNSATYFTWFKDFSNITTITADELGNITMGKNIVYRPGTRLAKITTDPKVYGVEEGGILRWIDSEATAKTLYGNNWATWIDDIPDAFFAGNYNNTNAVSNKITTQHPAGTLIKYANSNSIYYVVGNGSKRLVTAAGFTANRFNEDFVVENVADTVSYTNGTDIIGSEAGLFPIAQGGGTIPIVVGSATVSLANDNPLSGTVVKNAARYAFLKVNITAGSDAAASVKLEVQRSGLSVNADFSSIAFLDGVVQIGNTKTLNSDSKCLSDSIVVPAGTTRSITVAGNMYSTLSAGTAVLSIIGIPSTGSVIASLPIVGNPMSLSNAVAIGTATGERGAYDPNLGGVNTSKEIGTTAYTFLSYKLTASTEDQQVEYIRFTNQGSIAATDLTNVKLYVDNAFYVNGTMNGDYAEFNLSTNPVTIVKGYSKEFSLVADIVGGSGRTIDFDIDKVTDVAIKGKTYGYYITPTAALNGGNTITVSAGKLTISKSNVVAVGNITEGQSNVALGSWNLKAQGESVEISALQFDIAMTGSTATTAITNCALYSSSNTAVTGAVDPATTGVVAFTDTVTVPVGDNVYTLKCNLSTAFTNGNTITVSADLDTASYWVVKGTVTGDSITEAPTTDIAANVQTLQAGSLVAYTSTTPVAQSLVAGTSQALFANLLFDATGSGEDVRITQIVITNTPVTAIAYDVTNIKLYVNGVALSVVNNGAEDTASTAESYTFNLSGSDAITIPKGGTVVVQVKGDISASATAGDHVFDLSTVTAQGVSTGTTVASAQAGVGAGQAMTVVSNGLLTTSLDSSTPQSALVAAGSTGVTLLVMNMEATYEDVELDSIMLTRENSVTAASSTANDYAKLYLYDEDGTKIVEAVPTAVDMYTITVPNSAFVVTNEDSDGRKLYVKADLAYIGTGLPGTSGHQLGWSVATTASVIATGKESGQGITEAGTANGTSVFYVYKSVPTVAMVALPTTVLANGTAIISKFSVTADAKGAIDLREVTFTVATTSCTVSSMKLYDVTSGEVELNATAVQANGSDIVNIVFDAAYVRTISAGATKTFVLKGTVTNAGTAGDSVVTSLNGDSAVIANNMYPTTYALATADTNGEFIWSDRSASSHSATTADWTNGYLVSGLNGTTNNAQVVSN